MRIIALIAVTLAPFSVASPAQAQDRLLTIFGQDKCPADAICVVAPESERYRIPKFLREPTKSPQSTSWAVRQQATLNEGKSGTGSCSTAGAGGWTGCWTEYMNQARAEAKAQKAAARDVP